MASIIAHVCIGRLYRKEPFTGTERTQVSAENVCSDIVLNAERRELCCIIVTAGGSVCLQHLWLKFASRLLADTRQSFTLRRRLDLLIYCIALT